MTAVVNPTSRQLRRQSFELTRVVTHPRVDHRHRRLLPIMPNRRRVFDRGADLLVAAAMSNLVPFTFLCSGEVLLAGDAKYVFDSFVLECPYEQIGGFHWCSRCESKHAWCWIMDNLFGIVVGERFGGFFPSLVARQRTALLGFSSPLAKRFQRCPMNVG